MFLRRNIKKSNSHNCNLVTTYATVLVFIVVKPNRDLYYNNLSIYTLRTALSFGFFKITIVRSLKIVISAAKNSD